MGIAPKPPGDPRGVGRGVFFIREPLDPGLNIPICSDLVTCEAIDDFDELDKLGQGFTSPDPLEQVDIGDGSVPRPTFINQNLEADYKVELIALPKEYVDCFAWDYTEMPRLS